MLPLYFRAGPNCFAIDLRAVQALQMGRQTTRVMLSSGQSFLLELSQSEAEELIDRLAQLHQADAQSGEKS